MGEKRYYWLKLPSDFFNSKRIKKLRKLAGGDTYTIIYLKMQLLAIQRNGVLEYTGLEPTFADELALDLDEDADNVAVTINFLMGCGLMETSDNKEYIIPYAVINTGTEGSSAKRMRELRDRKSSQCDVISSQCDSNVTKALSHRYGEKEIEIEKEIEVETEIEREKKAAPARHKYGAYENVLFTDEEFAKLKEEFPNDWADRIERLSEYIASSGKKYKSHLATIRAWARKDKGEGSGNIFLDILKEEQSGKGTGHSAAIGHQGSISLLLSDNETERG